MVVLKIQSWRELKHPRHTGISNADLSARLKLVTDMKDDALNRLVIRIQSRQVVRFQLREGVDPKVCLDFLRAYGADACLGKGRN